MSEIIRVLVADDHAIVRQGLFSVITPSDGMEVVGQAVNGAEAVEMARSLQPDVILIDLVMPEKSGLDAIREIKQENQDARILVLTSFGDDNRVSEAIQSGALGFILKDSSIEDLFHAIREVYAANMSLPAGIAQKLIHGIGQPPTSQSVEFNLTRRELEVLKLIAQGSTNQEIANDLSIGQGTVRSHVSSLLGKLGLTNRTQVALYAIDRGLVDRD